MSEGLVIARIRKGPASEVWVVVTQYAGTARLDVREYFRLREGQDWLPTRKGVSIRAPLVGEAVAAAEELVGASTPGEAAAVSLGPKTRLRFAICEFNKRVYAEIRTYYREDTTVDQWKPGKGVTFQLAVVSEVVKAMRMAGQQFPDA